MNTLVYLENPWIHLEIFLKRMFKWSKVHKGTKVWKGWISKNLFSWWMRMLVFEDSWSLPPPPSKMCIRARFRDWLLFITTTFLPWIQVRMLAFECHNSLKNDHIHSFSMMFNFLNVYNIINNIFSILTCFEWIQYRSLCGDKPNQAITAFTAGVDGVDHWRCCQA